MPDEDIISLQDIFQTLNSYKWSILGFTMATTILAVLVTFSMIPIYRATAVLEIEQEQAKVLSIEEMYGIDGGGDSYLNTQYEVLKSRGVMEKVIRQLDLLTNAEYNASLRPRPWYADLIAWRSWFGINKPVDFVDEAELAERTLNGTINVLLANVTVEPVRKTQIVKIHVTSENPTRAAQIANALAGAYIGSYLEAKLSLTTSATSWMQDRVQELSGKLTKAEEALQAYRERENLVEMEGVLTLSTSELAALTDSLVRERRTLTVTGNIYRQIQVGRANGQNNFEALPAVLAHPLIQDLKQQEAQVERNVQDLSRRYGNKHPKMISARSELDSIQGNIALQVKQILGGIENEYKAAKANEASLSKAVDKARKQVQEINRKQFRLQSLEREVSTNKDLYDAFFKRIQETSATADLQTANARIVDNAYPVNNPIKPNKKLIVMVSALMGLLLSSGMAFLQEMLNNTIRSARDVEDKLNLQVLGHLPTIHKKSDEEMHQLFNDSKETLFGEAMRTIRTSVNLSTLGKDKRVLAITSSVPNEGKSTVSSNLALAMSQLGKTLIIGCDMRRPTLGKRMGIKGGVPGLSNTLSGANPLSECIHTIGTLDVMPSGVVPHNPQELLASKQFGKMIEELRALYDTIILDCPPIQSVSDTLMISMESDGLIYVVESGRVQASVITAALGRLLQSHAHIAGVVINKANPDKEHGYGYYGYEEENPAAS